ncbi:MAG: histidine utilization repressor [Thermodesulfobacteriota bacterium]|nr:histidine utilization repressor [Thermodesulfobacteriota bacterium]
MSPLFQQVKNYIIERIDTGVWKHETRISSENEIAKTLKISRSTATRALRELTAEGYLVRIQGVGTFVAPLKPHFTLLEIKSISDEIVSRGGKHSCDVHLLTQETASLQLSSAMEIPESSPVFHSIIVHKNNGKPIQLADRYVNPNVAPDYLKQDFTVITPSQYLFQMGPLTEAEHTIESVMPDKRTRNLLEMDEDKPCLVIHRRTWSNKLVSTKATLIHPGSRFKPSGRFKPNSRTRPLID